ARPCGHRDDPDLHPCRRRAHPPAGPGAPPAGAGPASPRPLLSRPKGAAISRISPKGQPLTAAHTDRGRLRPDALNTAPRRQEFAMAARKKPARKKSIRKTAKAAARARQPVRKAKRVAKGPMRKTAKK